ncbi:hypothetical protein [Bradyrhizobium cenepequi]|uniref:hypothetical protein n=1 Tax=Bradyrhizobium cenepequi TaxID=2821403 RepID=UPI001CE34C1F|nr:hypothetical protein [Bradyrhizobium cenepequi]MCA6108976.1 hypothetical protein [Bradyrhizobium cenepequi]
MLQINLHRGSLSSINREQCSKAVLAIAGLIPEMDGCQQREIEFSRLSPLKGDFDVTTFKITIGLIFWPPSEAIHINIDQG